MLWADTSKIVKESHQYEFRLGSFFLTFRHAVFYVHFETDLCERRVLQILTCHTVCIIFN